MEKDGEDRVASKLLLGREEAREADVIGFGGYPNSVHHPLFSHCKEVYLVSEKDKRKWSVLPRTEYPKPLIFHDGRIAFRPTPISTLCMFLWMPLAFLLAIARAAVFIFLPYIFSVPLLGFMGMHSRVITSPRSHQAARRQLYISNHRTLLDPLYISAVLGHHVTATTYSVSRISEMLSPVRTVRLTRNREQDKGLMKKLLHEGALVVCPEGTTCREPYLIRFSPLFAEVSEDVVPVALESRVSMFYGTSTSKLKFLDPLCFLMNPFPRYAVEFMEKVATGWIGGNKCSSCEIANHLQGEIGKRLGFECTSFTRRDKYLMLASNDGSL
ncbi:glycerol-3-phosphate acyltransferase [Musa troglodytarum]|nr:glycerol-3-phosphate acyltransferase [Musa troglodytarum]